MGVQVQYTKVERLQLGPVQEIAEDEDNGTGCFYARELTVTHKEGQHSVNLFADTPGALTLPGEPRPDEWKPMTVVEEIHAGDPVTSAGPGRVKRMNPDEVRFWQSDFYHCPPAPKVSRDFTRCPSCGKTQTHPLGTALYRCVCGLEFLRPHAGDRVTHVNDSGEGFVHFVYPDGKHVRLVGGVDPVPVIDLAKMP